MSHLSKREIGDVIHPVPGDETHANRSVATEETVGVTVDQGDPEREEMVDVPGDGDEFTHALHCTSWTAQKCLIKFPSVVV